MAVTQVGHERQYAGLAADTKPPAGPGRAGDRFLETDTGDTYVWSGTAWVLESTNAGASIDVNDAITADVDAAVAATPGLRLMGFASRESAATAAVATFRLVHGATVAGGTTLYPVELSAGESRGEWFGPDGIAVPNGVSIDWIAGTVDVVLFYKVVV